MARSSRHLVPGVLVVVLLALAAAYQFAYNEPPAGQGSLVSVSQSGLQELQTAFNGAAGETRVILLLSPT